MSVVDLRAETRAYARGRLRELALDAAREVVVERGWAAVRMGAIATRIGISRQSLHAEFGTKDDLGNALVLRELERFFDGVAARLADHPGDLAAAVSAAGQYMLSVTRDDPLLTAVLTGSTVNGDGESLLPLLTVRGEPLIDSAMALVADWATGQWPDADPEDMRLMVETVVRLCQSHILTPTKTPAEAAADLARVASRCLPLT